MCRLSFTTAVNHLQRSTALLLTHSTARGVAHCLYSGLSEILLLGVHALHAQLASSKKEM